MLNFVALVVLLTVPSDFACSQQDLVQALPQLQVMLKKETYDAIVKVSQQIAASKPQSRPAENGILIEQSVKKGEIELVRAVIAIRNGYFSISDKNIVAYVGLQAEVGLIRAVNNRCLNEMYELADKLGVNASSTDFQSTLKHAEKMHHAAYQNEIRKLLPADKASRLDALFTKCDHQRVYMKLITDRIRVLAREADKKKTYESHHPSIQPMLTGDLLYLMDQPVCRKYLSLTPEQNTKMDALYKDYMHDKEKLQNSLSNSLSAKSDDPWVFHQKVAQDLSTKYKEYFVQVLTKPQIELTNKLRAQVVGVSALMSKPISGQFSFTSAQERQWIKQSAKETSTYVKQHQGNRESDEWKERFFEYMDQRFRDSILTEEQRKAWDAFLEPKLAPDELKALRKLSKQRTDIWIKAPGK